MNTKEQGAPTGAPHTSSEVENHCKDSIFSQTSAEQSFADKIRAEEKHLKPQMFPTWAMPKDIQILIEIASKVYGLPPEMFAIPILTAIAVAIGNKAEFKWKNYTNYPQIWGAIVGESGINKTSPSTIAFKPIREREKETYETYKQEKALYKSENESTQKPVLKHLTTQDATLEGLTSTMRYNSDTMCYNPDELDSFFQSIAGRYKVSSDAGHYVSMFNNQQISIHRAAKDKEPILLETPILSVCGTIQPEILKKNVTKLNMVDSGFLQRFLFVYPENIIEQPENNLVIPEEVIAEYSNFIDSLLLQDGKKIYELDASANSEFIAYLNEFKKKRNAAAGNPFLRSMLAKLEISFHRLCVIIEHANNRGKTNAISLDSVNCAQALTLFFLKEGEKIVQLVTSNKNGISKGDVCKFLKNEYPNKKQTEIAEFLGITKQNFYEYCKN